MNISIRLVSTDDADQLTRVLVAERAFLAPWQPKYGEDYFTTTYQQRELGRALARYQEGASLPYAILGPERQLIGRINVNNVVRGAFHSGDLGYWVSQACTGQGVGTAAVAAIVDVAFGQHQLHRLQAGTLRHNFGSQRVLERNGFDRIGVAPKYLRIAGSWQDHLLYQRINDAEVQPA